MRNPHINEGIDNMDANKKATENVQPQNAEQVTNQQTESNTGQVINKIPLPALPELMDAENLSSEVGKETDLKKQFEVYVDKFINSANETGTETYDEQTAVLEESRITTKTLLKPVETLLSIGGVSVIERGDIYGIKGKSKSGKTSANKALIGAALLGECCSVKAGMPDLKVAYLDTEQKPQDTQGILNYVRKMAGDDADDYIDNHFHLFSLRKRDYSTLTKDLLRIIIDYRPDIIIADGIADFVRSFNDEEVSKAIILFELRLVDEFDCAIINLIHENKAYDDHNAKGHLGQLLTQKAAIVMETRKEGEIIKVTCSESRHKSMPDWYLMYDENDVLCDATEPYKAHKKAKSEKTNAQYLKVAKEVLKEAGKPINRTELSKKMAEKTGKSQQWMATVITSLIGKGLYLDGNMVQTEELKEQEG